MVDHFKTGLDLVSNFTKVNEILASVRDAMGKYGFDILNASRRQAPQTKETAQRKALSCFLLLIGLLLKNTGQEPHQFLSVKNMLCNLVMRIC